MPCTVGGQKVNKGMLGGSGVTESGALGGVWMSSQSLFGYSSIHLVTGLLDMTMRQHHVKEGKMSWRRQSVACRACLWAKVSVRLAG